MSSAFPKTLTDQQQTSGLFDALEKTVSSTSSSACYDQQQITVPSNIIKKTIASTSPPTLIDQQQTAAPSSAVEDQLREQIVRLEDEVRQLKLDQDSKREALRHTLLQEELSQFREKNLNLRVELQVAQEAHRFLEQKHKDHHAALESEHEKCTKLMQKAIQGVAPCASSPRQQSVGSLPVDKASGTIGAFQFGDEIHPSGFLKGTTSGGSSAQANVFRQSLLFPPRAFPTSKPHAPKPLFPGSSSGSTPSLFCPLITALSPTVDTAAGSSGPQLVNFDQPASSMFGDPEQSLESEADGRINFVNTPGYYGFQEQSFEEARLRRYELRNVETEPPSTPKWPETFGKSRASAPGTCFEGSSLSPSQILLQQSNERITGGGGGCLQSGNGSLFGRCGVPAAGGFSKPAKPVGDGAATVTSASEDTKKYYTAKPYQGITFGR